MGSTAITFDWTINVGNILTLLALLGGGAWYLITSHFDQVQLRKEMTLFKETVKEDVDELKQDVGSLRDVLVTLAQHGERFSNIEGRVSRNETAIDDLRRGEGFVLPLRPR